MAQNCFHPSIEGAQHGAKSLPDFLDYAKRSGAAGAQPSNFMLQAESGFQKAADIKKAFADRGLKLDGISAQRASRPLRPRMSIFSRYCRLASSGWRGPRTV